MRPTNAPFPVVRDSPLAGPGGGGKMSSGAWKRGPQNPIGVISLCSPIFFADDTNLFHHGTDLSVVECEFSMVPTDISTWLKVNKLSLNIKKTNYMIFSRKKLPHPLDLRVDNQNVHVTKPANSVKYS